ncbi:MAG: hypothetical protein Q8K45_11275 [Rubrivivax sp.]|nr:hypothetical protein [Rubrivivax sp.]
MLAPAWAAGLGVGASSAVLGQPLDFPVQVRLDADDLLTADCLSAEVTLGNRRLPAAAVRTALEMTSAQTARIRVLTTVVVDEPVVGVLLNANCGALRLSRRFVVLADPPLLSAAAPSAGAYTPAFAAAPTAVPAAPTAGPVAAAGMSTAESVAGVPAAGVAPERPPAAAERASARPGHAQPQGQSTRALRRAERRAGVPPRGEAMRTATRTAQRAAQPAAARLRLEPAEPASAAQSVAIDEALAAVAEAASAARAAAAAASVAAARIASLESDVASLRKEAGSSREAASQLRERLMGAEQSGRWTWPLLALVLLLTALAAWLAWRLNAAERARQRGWKSAAQPSPAPGTASELTPSKLPTAPIPFVTSELNLPVGPAARKRPLHAWPAPAPLDTQPPLAEARSVAPVRPPPPPPRDTFEPPMQRTEPLPPQGALVDDAAARDVSIEELIDLEQQAEFFVVLGQDDAAIDLLVEHLRHTGGGSPLPYLKLLEIYRRRGEHEYYERMRTRFNHRFNAYAPEWGVDLQAGRSLETYPGVIPRLQQVWSRPLDAMAELEALLFRKSRGELFDLPAYREVLFLYSLARDLLDRDAAASGNVDLLLPLADGGEFSSTSPAPFVAQRPEGQAAARDGGGRITEPLDFDLSADAGPATSLFGPLEGTADRPSRR